MADKQMKFTLDFLAKTAGLKDAAELSDKLGDSLDDTVDSGKQLAMAMRLAADKIEGDLEQTRQIADKLGNALGPEMAAKIGQSRLDDMAVKFRAAGLTIQDVDANIDELADGVKRLDSAADAARGLDQSIAKVGATTDNTRSVVANFAGNSIQEIPGITGAMGPLNMAIGQFGEYAAEGNIKLSKFVGAGAGLAAVALVMGSMAKNAKLVAEAKAWRTNEIKAFVEAARNGEDATQALVDRLTEAGEIIVKFGGMLNELVGGDLVDELATAGVSVEQFSQAVTGGEEGLANLKTAMERAGVGAGEIGKIMIGAQVSQDNYNQSIKTAEEFTAVFGDATADLGDKAANAAPKVGDMAAANAAVADHAAAAEEATREFYDTLVAFADGSLSYVEAVDRAEDAVADFDKVLGDADSSLEEIDDSARNAAGALIETAKAGVELDGASLDTKAGVDALKESLFLQAMSMAPDSPLRKYLVDYIADLNSTPTSITTTLTLIERRVGAGAGADQGDGGWRAAGGPVLPGNTYRVGEQGPEPLTMSGTGAGVVAPSSAPSSAPAQQLDPAAFGREAAVEFARVLRQQMRAS